MKKKILYVFRTPRNHILIDTKKGLVPNSMLFGLNHLREFGYQVDFFDYSYSLLNFFHPLLYPFEHAIIDQVGMGFKLDQATALLPKIHQYDVIVCTGDSAGLPFLFYKYLGIIRKPIILLSSALAGALRTHMDSWVINFYKKIIPSVDVMTVYAEIEKEFFVEKFGMPPEKIIHIPYGTDWNFFSKKNTREKTIISAVGVDSLRDYDTFFKAVRNLSEKVVVACHPDNVKGLIIPKNVACEFLVPPQRVRDIFNQSKLVVVPCKEKLRGSGHMVVLEALSAARPVIVSKIKGMTSAFSLEDKKHLLYAKPHNPSALTFAIKSILKNQRAADRMGQRGSLLVKNQYTSYHLAINIDRILKSVL